MTDESEEFATLAKWWEGQADRETVPQLRHHAQRMMRACQLAHERVCQIDARRDDVDRSSWMPIDQAPLSVWGLAWHPVWRRAFPAMRNGDDGAVWVDTCEPMSNGWQAFATHWRPAPPDPAQFNSERSSS